MYPIYEDIETFDARRWIWTCRSEPKSFQTVGLAKSTLVRHYLHVRDRRWESVPTTTNIRLTHSSNIRGFSVNWLFRIWSRFCKILFRQHRWWNEFWLNDRMIARRPWLNQRNFSTIDLLLRENVTSQNDNGTWKCRRCLFEMEWCKTNSKTPACIFFFEQRTEQRKVVNLWWNFGMDNHHFKQCGRLYDDKQRCCPSQRLI